MNDSTVLPVFLIHLDVDICEHKCFFVSQYSHIEFGFPWWLNTLANEIKVVFQSSPLVT